MTPYKDPVKQRLARRKYRLKNLKKTRAHNREYIRKAIAENPEKFRKRSSEWRKKHPEFMRNYRKKVPLMTAAHNKAIRNIDAKKCEVCGSTENLERHHPDYSKPLEVQVLCKRCHNAKHHPLLEELKQ